MPGGYLASTGQLVSNRGELIVRTTSGVCALRFGDVAPGPDVLAAPTTSARYLFIMVDFDPASARTPGRASEGAEKVKLLRARFVPWYYVIAAESLDAVRLRRADLVKRRVRRST